LISNGRSILRPLGATPQYASYLTITCFGRIRSSSRMCEFCRLVFSDRVGLSRVNCCWSTPAQSFLVPCPPGLMTIFYCPTTLGVVQLNPSCVFSRYPFRNSDDSSHGCPHCLLASACVLIWNPFMVIFPSLTMLEACSQRLWNSDFVYLRISYLKRLFNFFFFPCLFRRTSTPCWETSSVIVDWLLEATTGSGFTDSWISLLLGLPVAVSISPLLCARW
jgi:hypothetical protein